jgi:hypothetical protein
MTNQMCVNDGTVWLLLLHILPVNTQWGKTTVLDCGVLSGVEFASFAVDNSLRSTIESNKMAILYDVDTQF